MVKQRREPEGPVTLQSHDKKGLLHADVTVLWKEELSGQTQTKGLRGVGGNLEGLKVKDRGPGRYSTLGGHLGKGHWTLTQTYVWRRSLLGEGLSSQWTQEAGPMGNQRWEKVGRRDTLPGRIHAERVRRPQWGPRKSTPTPVFSRAMTPHCASQWKLNEGPVYP